MRDIDELTPIIEEQFERMREDIYNANRMGEDELREALRKWNWTEESTEQGVGLPGRILVVGQSQVKEAELVRAALDCGFPAEDIDFVLGYKASYRFSTLEFSDTYSDVLFGPLPHSQDGKGSSSSIITQMEAAPDRWPNPVRLTANRALKITKESFTQALKETRAYKQMTDNEIYSEKGL